VADSYVTFLFLITFVKRFTPVLQFFTTVRFTRGQVQCTWWRKRAGTSRQHAPNERLHQMPL